MEEGACIRPAIDSSGCGRGVKRMGHTGFVVPRGLVPMTLNASFRIGIAGGGGHGDTSLRTHDHPASYGHERCRTKRKYPKLRLHRRLPIARKHTIVHAGWPETNVCFRNGLRNRFVGPG